MKPIKTTTLFIALVAITHSVWATVRTVSNNTNSPGQYTSLQAAHDAAANGDTLYIHASGTSYGDLTMQKQLTLIGEGAMPNTQSQYGTDVYSITLSYAPAPGITTAGGARIFGLKLWALGFGSANSTGTAIVGGVTVSRCRIANVGFPPSGGGGLSSANLFSQNVIWNVNGFFRNSSFLNNIIYDFNIHNINSSLFDNNVISNNIIQSGFHARGALVSNNIFYNYGATGSIDFANCYSITFTKNLFYAATSTPVTASGIIYGSNTGSGNLIQQDPLFISQELAYTIAYPTPGYSYSTPANGPFANFHLQATSPGKNYGTDGLDIGLYGGGYAWVDGDTTDSRFRYFPLPNQVPHVISMDVLNSAVPQNATLNVNFNARTQP